jgi:hypothetical protein
MTHFTETFLADGTVNPLAVDAARFDVHGILFDNIGGIGAVPYAHEIAYFGALVFVTPSAFLSVVAPLGGRGSVDYLVASGMPFGMPMLKVDIVDGTGCVIGHEGRSRMTALMESYGGDIRIPVGLILHRDSAPLRARHLDHGLVSAVSASIIRERYTGDGGPVVVDGPLFCDAVYRSSDGPLVFSRHGSPRLDRDPG